MMQHNAGTQKPLRKTIPNYSSHPFDFWGHAQEGRFFDRGAA
jgi:hypothetical protein